MKIYILLLAITLLIISCGPVEKNPNRKLSIENNSSYNVEITIFNAGLPDQAPTDAIISLPSNTGRSYFYESSDEYLLVEPADSAYIKFNDERQIIYRKNDGQPRNILDVNSWDYTNGVSVEHVYTYSITDEDYENAIEIK